MDCKSIAQNDLFEKYLLQRLVPQEKAEFEKHLAGCADCRNEFKRQEQLLAGIRETGVLEIKAEIRRQVAAQEAADKKINWAKVSRIAALFFIIIISPTVFYIYKYYIPEPKTGEAMRAMD